MKLKENGFENLKEAEAMFQGMSMDYWLGKTRAVLAKLRTSRLSDWRDTMVLSLDGGEP